MVDFYNVQRRVIVPKNLEDTLRILKGIKNRKKETKKGGTYYMKNGKEVPGWFNDTIQHRVFGLYTAEDGCIHHLSLPIIEARGLVTSIVYYPHNEESEITSFYHGAIHDETGYLLEFRRQRGWISKDNWRERPMGEYLDIPKKFSREDFIRDVFTFETAKTLNKEVRIRGVPFCNCREEKGLYIKSVELIP